MPINTEMPQYTTALFIYLFIYLLNNCTHGTTEIKRKNTIKLVNMRRDLAHSKLT